MKTKGIIACLVVLLVGVCSNVQAKESRDQQKLLEYLELYRDVAIKHQVTERFMSEFTMWLLAERAFSRNLVNALIVKEEEIGFFSGADSQTTYENIRQRSKVVLGSGRRLDRPHLVSSPVTGVLLDKPGEALYVVSLLWKHFPQKINEYQEMVIAYAVVWDAAVYFNIRGSVWDNDSRQWQSVFGPGGPKRIRGYYYTPDEYIVSHFKMFGSWNEKGELVFDLRQLKWSDIVYIISTGKFNGNGSVIKYPLEDLNDLHKKHWKGGAKKTFKAFIDMNWPEWQIRRYQSRFDFPAYPWNAKVWNCVCISHARRIIAQVLGIPAAEAPETIVFIHQHGNWSNGNPRWGQSHYMTAYKRLKDGEWFFGIGALENDNPRRERGEKRGKTGCNIPSAFTIEEVEKLPNEYFLRNDIVCFEIELRHPQTASEVCLFYRRVMPWQRR